MHNEVWQQNKIDSRMGCQRENSVMSRLAFSIKYGMNFNGQILLTGKTNEQYLALEVPFYDHRIQRIIDLHLLCARSRCGVLCGVWVPYHLSAFKTRVNTQAFSVLRRPKNFLKWSCCTFSYLVQSIGTFQSSLISLITRIFKIIINIETKLS